MKTREYWLDYLRAFACILVTMGHLLMSFQDSHIIGGGSVVSILIELIYCFHVYIFFFCSGYLFQNRNLSSAKSASLYRIEKCVNFLILYIIFSGVTYAIKMLFSSDVNTSVEGSFLNTLFKNPINQMWYLYAIAIIYLLAHSIRSEKSAWILSLAALSMKVLVSIPVIGSRIPLPIHYLFENMIWFVLGQLFAYKKIRLGSSSSLIFLCLFASLFACRCVFDLDSELLNAMLTLLGILASAGILYNLTKHKTAIKGAWKYLAKYMLQIYLLHTVCAAGIRILLLKVGITHILPHLVLGMVFSFAVPVMCAILAERIKFLNIVFFPVQTVKEICRK